MKGGLQIENGTKHKIRDTSYYQKLNQTPSIMM